MSKAKVRFLQETDVGQVALLIHQLTKNIVEPEKLEERIRDRCFSGTPFNMVAEEEGVVVGHAQLSTSTIFSKGPVGMIEEVVVDERHRRKGVGKLLMAELTDMVTSEFISVNQLKLTARRDAVGLYEKFGFVPKPDEVVMVLKLR